MICGDFGWERTERKDPAFSFFIGLPMERRTLLKRGVPFLPAMKTLTVKAQSIEEALDKIRREYGSTAQILNIRQGREKGVSRLWKKNFIEVVAAQGTQSSAKAEETNGTQADTVSEGLDLVADEDVTVALEDIPSVPASGNFKDVASTPFRNDRGLEIMAKSSSVESILVGFGLMPIYVQQIADEVELRLSDLNERTPALILRTIRDVLLGYWKPARPEPSRKGGNLHLLIGPPGSGKTTLLCKWLSRKVLVSKQKTHVWRLDGEGPNTSEMVSMYAEVLGLPEERLWSGLPEEPFDTGFMDLPGVDWRDSNAIQGLKQHIAELGHPTVTLVLNAAYETTLLMNQARSFGELPVDSVCFTHMDEIASSTKLWNFVLGTNFPMRFLGAGQNIPGALDVARPEKIFPFVNR